MSIMQMIKNESGQFEIVGKYNNKKYFPRFDHYTSAEDYEAVRLRGYEPMTAKEIETEEQQDEILNDPNYIIEEKFDGTRALLYFLKPNKFKRKGMSTEQSNFHSALERGSGFEGGKSRIYNMLTHCKDYKEVVTAIKDEYGTGGCTHDFPTSRGFVDYNSKGLRVKPYDDDTEYIYKWNEVAENIDEMIHFGEYYPEEAYTRCFSRRISEKTGWYCENTDSLPQLRELCIPELAGTVIDGEMYIPCRPFKDVSATLNCKWDKAIDRQLELGFICFHAFDILFYKGIDLRNMPLERRKVYLELVVKKVNSPYVKMVIYDKCANKIDVRPYYVEHGTPYTVCRSLEEQGKLSSYPNLMREYKEYPDCLELSPRAFYEFIVASGGEGVMVKPLDGKYYHKRGREYQKIKKYLTREVIIMGFVEPTDDYKGKFPTIDKWNYWETVEGDRVDLTDLTISEREVFKRNWYPNECRPISKFYCYNWIGTIRFGVVISPEEMHKLPKNKKFNVEEMIIEGDDVLVLEVGECSGFDEEERKMFSADPKKYIGSVIEVKANEIFKDTGKLRHPRFMRLREDKSPLACTFKDHIG